MRNSITEWFNYCKGRLKENSCENLMWLINLLPAFAGFPYMSKKINVLFWIIHTILLFYICVLVTVVYQTYYAEGFLDSINSFLNISVFIVIFNNSWWMLFKRNDLNDLLKIVKISDDWIIKSGRFMDKHQKMLKNIKITIISCYVFHFVNDVMIYIPNRMIDVKDFSIASCVGLEPLARSPNRQICMGILAAQELTGIVAVASYDVTLLFLFSHVTATFNILFEDMTIFAELAKAYVDTTERSATVRDRLQNLVLRHSLALRAVKKIQSIYSVSIGIGFGLNAISMCLFCMSPLDVCFKFAPLIYYSLFVFFLYCYQGQRLTTASEKFQIAVYCCGWENLGVKEQKYVLLMLKQAQKPVMVLAADVIPMRIHTFANTMQLIYKSVAVFKL